MTEEEAAQGPKVAIVDDHQLFSSGLALVLAASPLSAKVWRFETPEPLVSGAGPRERWDVILLDMFVPGYDATETIKICVSRWPDAVIVMVSGSRSPRDEAACLNAGAAAFFNKSADPEQLRTAIQNLLAGEDAAVQAASIDDAAAAYGLSPRQLEIIMLAAEGLSNKEIALAINVSPETVKTHLSTVFQKLGARNRMEAIEAARSRGLV